MHQAGINVRFMGRVRSHILRPDLRRILLLDMLARLLKTQLNAALRTKMEEVCSLAAALPVTHSAHSHTGSPLLKHGHSTHLQVRLSLEEPYKTVVANFFNRLTQETEVSANYWNKELKVRHLARYFVHHRAINCALLCMLYNCAYCLTQNSCCYCASSRCVCRLRKVRQCSSCSAQ